jgi:RNA polymerase sigma-70 factor (ECF subfamily)
MAVDESLSNDELRPALERAARGDPAAWQDLLGRFHARLRRMVAVRLDPLLHQRVDPSDVLQEAYLDAFEQLPGFLSEAKYPFFLWLRLVAGHRLSKLHRYHLGTQMRDAARDVSIFRGAMPEASSVVLASQLLGKSEAPADELDRAERHARLHEALNELDPLDREALCLRHFEQLSATEAAEVLGISKAAAGKRYIRALERLRRAMADGPGGLDGLA